jgi:hypothetical protein
MFSGVAGQMQLLDFLQGRSGWGKRRRQHMLNQAEYYRPSVGLVHDPNLEWTVEIAPAEDYARAERILTETLCAYVDAWLESARTPNGKRGYFEEPKKRVLSMAAQAAVNGYLADPEGRPRFFVVEGNKIGYVFAEEKPQRIGPDDPIREAKREADRLLVHFMDSDARWQLARCSHCAELFYPKRIQEFYKRGAEHPECRSKASEADRYWDWTQRVLALAAEAWPRWKPAYGPRELWVARDVNRKLPPDDEPIAGNWVTRHSKDIEKKVLEVLLPKSVDRTLTQKRKPSESKLPDGTCR